MDWYVWTLIGIVIVWALGYIYIHIIKPWLEYRRAKKEIVSFVISYKRRCTGNNRFIVTVESLQDSFRTYNVSVITEVWLDLVHERVIEMDPQDQEWCIR